MRHSHIDISYWKWLEHVLISPSQHQVHHSIAEEHYDKNFGAALAIWDWIFGSLHLSQNKGKVVFGLDAYDTGKESKLIELYLEPIYEITKISKVFLLKNLLGIKRRVIGLKNRFLGQPKRSKS